MFDEEKKKEQCETMSEELSEDMLEKVSGGMYEGDDAQKHLEQGEVPCQQCGKWVARNLLMIHMSQHM